MAFLLAGLLLQDDLVTAIHETLRKEPWSLETLDKCERIFEERRVPSLWTFLKDWDRAASGIEAAPGFLLFRARLSNHAHGRTEFLKQLQQIERQFPTDPPTLFHLGKTHLELDRFAEARASLEKLLREDPKADRRPAVRLWLAECCAKTGAAEEASAHFRAVEEKYDAVFLATFASRIGLVDDSARHYRKLLEAAPGGAALSATALARMHPDEALAELDPDGRTGFLASPRRLSAMRAYRSANRHVDVVRSGLALLRSDGADAGIQRNARLLIGDSIGSFKREQWEEFRRLPLPPPPAAVAEEVKRRLEELSSDDVQTRTTAREALRGKGIAALPLLAEKCVADDPDLQSNIRELIRLILTRGSP